MSGNCIADRNGYYGRFGGAYVPEILHKCVTDLQDSYRSIIDSEEFRKEYHELLRDYVGRPSPLYHARRMSAKYGCRLYLKREDLNHTGAHKINNTVGQILMARRMGKTRIIAETGAGQHGVATATVCALMGMRCEIFMGKTDGASAYECGTYEDARRGGPSGDDRKHDAERRLLGSHTRLVLASEGHILYRRQHNGTAPVS